MTEMDTEERSSLFNLQNILMTFALHWKWFIPSVVVCLLIGFVYWWNQPTTMAVTGKMRLIQQSQEKGNAVSAGLAVLSSLPLGIGNNLSASLGGAAEIDVEKEVIRSSDLVTEVVLDLGLYTEYRMGRWGRSYVLYKDQPVTVALDRTHLLWMDRELPLHYHQISLTLSKDSEGYHADIIAGGRSIQKNFKALPDKVMTEVGTLFFSPNQSLTPQQRRAYADGFQMQVTIRPPMTVAAGFIGRMVAEAPTKSSTNMLHITVRDENMMRGIDFITRLVDIYNQQGREDMRDQNRLTDQFVNQRLVKINEELGISDDAYEQSKVKYQITQPAEDAAEAVGKKSQYDQQLIQIGIQLQLHDYMMEFAQNPANIYEVIPVVSGGMGMGGSYGGSMGTMGGGGQALSRHNTLAFQRKELLKGMSDKAPQVQRVTELIEELRPTLLTELSRTRQAMVIQRQNVEREYQKAMERIGSAPHIERVFTDIERLREIKQGVYLVMLQKREELAMGRVDVTDKGKLIEKAQVVSNSVLPNRNMIMLIALAIGILLPLVVLILFQFLRTKVGMRSDIESASRLPILGDVFNVHQEEALRTVRTNLLLHLQPGQKTLLVTSDAVGDGKTYQAIQLAQGLARLDKKVVLVDLDLRHPGIAQALGITAKGGTFSLLNLTSPVAADVQSQLVTVDNIDVLPAGTPSQVHPSDLLSRDSLVQVLTLLKAHYDYVIIDGPAMSGNSDTLQIATQADATCFIVKADHTAKAVVKAIDKESRLPHTMFIYNLIDMSKKKNKYLYKQALMLLSFVLVLSSCSVKKFAYLQGADKIDLNKQSALYDARIMPKDQLNIHVYTINAGAATPFNMGYGTINFPILGRIKVVGLTKDECEDMILEKIRPYMAESERPIVTVRQANYSITVLGEVGAPGTIQVSREKINIYEALAQAGDLTVYGIRDRVKLIRENADGEREIHMLDLSDANIMNSPYFYMQQNDILYVEPSIVKKQQGNIVTSLVIPLTTSLVSFSALLIAIFK